MSTITTSAHPKELWPGIKKIFGKTYKEKELRAPMVFTEVSSEKAYEKYLEQTGFGLAAIKSESGSISYDTDQSGYEETLTNVTYGLGAKVSMEAIQDNQYEAVAKSKAKKLARSMRHTIETVGANILNRGFNSSYTGGDGLELFSAAHTTLSGNQANEPTAGMDFSEAALEDALNDIQGFKDARGLRIGVEGVKLVIPRALHFDAIRVLSSTNQSATANNDINAMKADGVLRGGTVTWDYLTDTDAWFVITDADDGLLFQNRMAPDLEQDNDFDTKNACMSTVARFVFGWGDWRGAWGSPGA